LEIELAGLPRRASLKVGCSGNLGKVEFMQQYSNYPYTEQTPKPSSNRGSKALLGSMVIFMFLGFAAGVALLVIRNWYLFS
jgi:hypothetical protein